MGLYLSVKKIKKGKDYLFVDELSTDRYENAIFRLNFKYDTLKQEHIEIIDEYLTTISNNLIEILNENKDTSLFDGSHEDRIKALEQEIATLTNNVNSQTPVHGTLKITPTTQNMDFNKDGTMIKFTNADNGVYTTSILQNGTETEIVLPVGVYVVNIVNSLNDITDSVFTRTWDNAISNDNNHTMTYTVSEGTTEITTELDYENILGQ